jgi:hypothetical protein
VSDPASKVRNTLRRAGDPRAITMALPATVGGRSGEPAPEPAGGEAGVTGTADGVEVGMTLVEGRPDEGEACRRTGEQAAATDAASQSTNTVRARIVMRGSFSHGEIFPGCGDRHAKRPIHRARRLFL